MDSTVTEMDENFRRTLVNVFLNNVILFPDHADLNFNYTQNNNKVTFIHEHDLVAVDPCSSQSDLVPRVGIEPTTRGFSVPCSTD